MTRKNRYGITIEFTNRWMAVYAKTPAEAKKIAYEKLRKKTALKFVNRKNTDVSTF